MSEYQEIVRRCHSRTTGMVAATTGRCVEIQEWELRHVRRNVVPVTLDALRKLDPQKSWVLAVVVCPGDPITDVVAWARRLPRTSLDRVRFYFAPGADEYDALHAWASAGLPPPRTHDVGSATEFHRAFGLHLNNQVVSDYRAHPEWFDEPEPPFF